LERAARVAVRLKDSVRSKLIERPETDLAHHLADGDSSDGVDTERRHHTVRGEGVRARAVVDPVAGPFRPTLGELKRAKRFDIVGHGPSEVLPLAGQIAYGQRSYHSPVGRLVAAVPEGHSAIVKSREFCRQPLNDLRRDALFLLGCKTRVMIEPVVRKRVRPDV
jgi:hypothetical protein